MSTQDTKLKGLASQYGMSVPLWLFYINKCHEEALQINKQKVQGDPASCQ